MTRKLCALLALATACGGRGASIGDAKLIPKQEVELAKRGLSAKEAKLVEDHGFAIVGGDRVGSFHVGYTALFHAHQPVYVTADSVLYAWHSSYDALLRDLELAQLVPALEAMLGEAREKLAASPAGAEARGDVDVYLTVAHALLKGAPVAPAAGGDPALIAALVDRGTRAEGEALALFGAPQKFDFTMLKPRGHYTMRAELQRYFRAMSWLGRVELRIATRDDPAKPWQIDRRSLRGAALIGSLFTGTTRAKWASIEATIAAFVGPADSMSVPGLEAGLAKLGAAPDAAPDAAVVAAFAGASVQKIRTQLAHAGEDSIAFVALGQRFVYDSKVMSDLVYGTLATKPPRLMPSSLDVGYAVLDNPAAKRLLAPELERYGAPYAAALEAAHAQTAVPDPALWNGSLYHRWLGALRALSPDAARDAGLPAPLTGDAWARRMLGTQLASWAELRHDNLLYAKQSVTGMLSCEYPDGYVEPYPAFFAAMEGLAKQGRATIDALPEQPRAAGRLLAYFDTLGKTMARLRAIAERERANQPLRAADLDFLNHMVSLDGRSGGCAITIEPQGWYADLYYDRGDILMHLPVIADVHTQPTDESGAMVGHVLHVGTGGPRMLVARLAHDGGAHAQTYRGFVSTFAEHVTKGFQRMTDEDWREKLQAGPPPQPAWLSGLIAP